MKNLAIEIVKLEGVEKSWNMKFYQPGSSVEIYIAGKKVDVTEQVNSIRDSNGMFQASPVIDEYIRIRTEAYRTGVEAMILKQDRNQAIENYINSL